MEKSKHNYIEFLQYAEKQKADYTQRYDVKKGEEGEPRLIISAEDYFRLIEHREIQQSLKSSKTATWFAIAALIVSLLTLVFSLDASFRSIDLSKKAHKSAAMELKNIDDKLTKIETAIKNLPEKK